MRIGIAKEIAAHERRVACTPPESARLHRLGYAVLVETQAGAAAGFADSDYAAAGATICADADALWQQADIVCKIRPPAEHPAMQLHEADLVRAGKTLISLLEPAQNTDLMTRIAAAGGTVIALDAIPRLSRAQKMDALSSMAGLAGYRAVIEAGQHFEGFFGGQITAAGKVEPARVLVIGAGVAGLAAIATAVSLGAVVRAFDTRPEVAQQIESMNAEFLWLELTESGASESGYAKVMSAEFIAAEMALFAAQAKTVDIIITTALIPGKPAPKLITAEMVQSMRRGSVIVDMAAQQGGNCALTRPGEIACVDGVTIVGYTDFPSRMAAQASRLLAANLRHLLDDLTPHSDGQLVLALDDAVIGSATVVHQGEVRWPPPPVAVSAAPAAQPAAAVEPPPGKPRRPFGGWRQAGLLALVGLALLAVGSVAPADFMGHFTVFVLACFVGWQVVWRVTPALHTPLMSVTNAISGIIVVGAMLQINATSYLAAALAVVALMLAAINIAGGFWVTWRMLKMFQRD